MKHSWMIVIVLMAVALGGCELKQQMDEAMQAVDAEVLTLLVGTPTPGILNQVTLAAIDLEIRQNVQATQARLATAAAVRAQATDLALARTQEAAQWEATRQARLVAIPTRAPMVAAAPQPAVVMVPQAVPQQAAPTLTPTVAPTVTPTAWPTATAWPTGTPRGVDPAVAWLATREAIRQEQAAEDDGGVWAPLMTILQVGLTAAILMVLGGLYMGLRMFGRGVRAWVEAQQALATRAEWAAERARGKALMERVRTGRNGEMLYLDPETDAPKVINTGRPVVLGGVRAVEPVAAMPVGGYQEALDFLQRCIDLVGGGANKLPTKSELQMSGSDWQTRVDELKRMTLVEASTTGTFCTAERTLGDIYAVVVGMS